MSEHIKQFIDHLAAGDSSAAKETLENVLSMKSFESLENYKKEIASSIFGNTEETTTQETE